MHFLLVLLILLLTLITICLVHFTSFLLRPCFLCVRLWLVTMVLSVVLPFIFVLYFILLCVASFFLPTVILKFALLVRLFRLFFLIIRLL